MIPAHAAAARNIKSVMEDKQVLKIAHRGAARYAPENTLLAVIEALRLGAHAVEIDVHRTLDGGVIVMHDHSVRRTTGSIGFIEALSLREIKQLKVRQKEVIPTLDEVFDVVKKKAILKIDIKDRTMEEDVLKIIKKHHATKSVIITSRISSVLTKIKELSPEIKTESGGWKKGRPPREIIRGALSLKADIVSPHYSITTKNLVDLAHRRGLEVHVWTVDDEKTAQQMKNRGVDGITTNYLDRI